jgi:hypothetical protein
MGGGHSFKKVTILPDFTKGQNVKTDEARTVNPELNNGKSFYLATCKDNIRSPFFIQVKS